MTSPTHATSSLAAAASTAHESSSTNVTVAVRCRPLNEREKTAGRPAVVLCKPNTNEIAIVKRKSYTFDKVYGQYSTQKDVFKATVKPVVDEALAGYNCTVFAYGQTGTGKTHTMQGDLAPDNEMAGIIPRCVRYIFDVLHANHQEYSVKVSFLQLYNEELKDLLAPSENKKLRLMEDVKRGGIYCQNLLEVTTTTASHVFELLDTGVKNRITSETLMNEHSSRSHSIFTIRIHSKENNPGGEDLLRIGQLNLVDLAGSECIGRSGARNARAREAGNINQSLLTLGRVITALVDNHPHIPYRDSKLTRLLQESLGGRAKTTIIATLAPCADSIDETLSTLEYAYRAKNIKNKPEMNQKMTKTGLLKEYGNEIESLRNALQAARAKDGIFLPPAQFAEMQERLAGQSAQIAELEDELENRSKTCKELEEHIDAQKEEISTLQREKMAIQANLLEKEAELESTKAQLARTQEELAEAQRVLELYQTNERVLIKNGATATKLYKASERRVDLLLEKINRKQAVEMANHELANEFADTAQSQLHAFEQRLTQHSLKQGSLFTDVDNAMDELRKTHTVDISALVKNLEELEATVNERQQQFEMEQQRESQATEEEKRAWEEVNAKRQKDLKDRLDQFVLASKQSAEQLIEQLATAKQTQHAHLTDIALNVSRSRDEMSLFLKEQSNKLAQLKVTLDSSFTEQVNQLAKHKQALVEALRQGQVQQKTSLEAMKEQLSHLIEESIATHARQIDADIDMVADHVDTHQAHLKQTQQLMAQEIDMTTNGMDEAETLQQTQFAKFEKRVAEVNMDVEAVHDNQNGLVQTQQHARKSWSDDIRAFDKKQSEWEKELIKTQRANFEDRLKTRADGQQRFFKSHELLRNGLVQQSDVVSSRLEKHTGGVKRKLEEIVEYSKSVVGDSASVVIEQREQVSDFIKKRRVDDPTGATPIKEFPDFPLFQATDVDGSPVVREMVLEIVEDICDENMEPEQDPAADNDSVDGSQSIESKESPSSERSEQSRSPIESDIQPSTTFHTGVPGPKQIVKPAARKRLLTGGSNLQRPTSGPSSLPAPTKKFRLKKAPLSETTNKL